MYGYLVVSYWSSYYTLLAKFLEALGPKLPWEPKLWIEWAKRLDFYQILFLHERKDICANRTRFKLYESALHIIYYQKTIDYILFFVQR